MHARAEVFTLFLNTSKWATHFCVGVKSIISSKWARWVGIKTTHHWQVCTWVHSCGGGSRHVQIGANNIRWLVSFQVGTSRSTVHTPTHRHTGGTCACKDVVLCNLFRHFCISNTWKYSRIKLWCNHDCFSRAAGIRFHKNENY